MYTHYCGLYLVRLGCIRTYMMWKLNNWFGNRDVLIKVRLYVYVFNLCHLTIVAAYLLGQDYSKSKDPKLQQYVKLKWKLLTTWFNLLLGPYLILSIVCELYELKGKGNSEYIKLMNKSRNFFFSSVLGPVTMFADILFWRLYNQDKRLVMPLSSLEFVSIWNHHSMHTVSLLFVLFELVCVPRQRPKDMKPEIITLTSFISLYTCICVESTLNQEFIYPFLSILPTFKLIVCVLYVYVANLFYYTLQWTIVDMVWGKREKIEFLGH